MSHKPYIEKPDLHDQHWRIDLRRRTDSQIEEDFDKAVKEGHLWRLDVLLGLDPAPARTEEYTRSAIINDHARVLDLFEKHDPEWMTRCNMHTLACAAARTGSIDMLKRFHADGHLDIHDNREEVLRTAAECGHLDIVDFVLARPDADIDALGGDALRMAAHNGHAAVVARLVEKGSNLSIYGDEALIAAAREGQDATVKFLVSKGVTARLNEALGYAAGSDSCETVETLILAGAQPDDRDGEALRYALRLSKYDNADILLKHGANINAENGAPLREAIGRRDLEGVLFLLGRNVKTTCIHYGDTPLMQAASEGQNDMVRALLQHGADHAALQYGALRKAYKRGQRGTAHDLFDHDKAWLARRRAEKIAEFDATFGKTYSLDNLRTRKGPSGDTGLMIAAETGKFDDLLKQAAGGSEPLLKTTDLFHPDHGVDTVYGLLSRHKDLHRFFAPALWVDRTDEIVQFHATLPKRAKNRISVSHLQADRNYRELQKKVRNISMKPPKP